MNPAASFSTQQTALIIIIVLALIILSGVVVVIGRHALAGRDSPDVASRGAATSLIRSWIAIVLVGAVVLFCGLSFGFADATLRNTLIGGLLASTGSASAYYFASKASDEARRDILGATTNTTVWVPTLQGLTVAQARALRGSTVTVTAT